MWLIHKNRKNIKKTASFAECFYPDTRQSNHFSISWKTYLPSVITLALGEVSNFAECQTPDTRQKPKLRRVRPGWHSAKFESLPSAEHMALGKVFDPSRSPVRRPVRQFNCPSVRPVSTFFAECDLAHGKSLPSAREKALGKAGFAG